MPEATRSGVILIVDDDPGTIHLLARSLRDFGRIKFATSGDSAMSMVRELQPDLVLLDLELPGTGGVAILQSIRGDPALKDTAVVCISAHISATVSRHLQDLGVDGMIQKPVAAPLMARIARNILKTQQLRPAHVHQADGYLAPSTLLVVDSDESVGDLLVPLLASWGLQVNLASSGAMALTSMDKAVPDAVLLELGLPDVDGLAIISAMKCDPALEAVPVVVMSSAADATMEARALDAGAVEFLHKPLNAITARARINSLLRTLDQRRTSLQRMDEHWQSIDDARVAEIVQAVASAILCVKASGTVVMANAAAEKLFRRPVQAMVGHPLEALLPPDVCQLVLRSGAGSAGGVSPALTPLMALDVPLPAGLEPVPAELNYFRVGQENEQLTTLVLRDLSEQRRADEATRNRIHAEAASQTKSRMLSFVAHEIGNPLNTILGLATILLGGRPGPLTAEQARLLKLLQAGGNTLRALLRDLLDIGQVEAGRFKVTLVPVLLNTVLPAAIEAVRLQHRNPVLAVQLDLGTEPMHAMADPARLEQCLVNLLSNAAKYGGDETTVHVSARCQANCVRIDVRDEGAGMSPEQVSQLFEPFNRLGRGQSGVAGSGLGLAVTKLLVEGMGGQLEVSSTPGNGSTFSLRLPMPPAPAAPHT